MKNCNFFINLINNPISVHKDLEQKNEYLKLLQAKQNTNLIINEPKEILKIFNKNENSKKCFNLKDLSGFNKFELYDFIFTKNFPYQSTSFLTNIIRGNQAKIKQGCKTVTNTFFILGSKESGKSTLLRGENILNDLKNEGVMLSIMKEAYKLCLNSVNDKNCLILIKLGIVVMNDGKIYNLINIPEKGTKNYFDECFINEKSETLIYIKHIESLRDVHFEIEKSLKRREEIIDLNWDNTLIYHFVLEIKNNNQETLLNLQFDFFEFNYNFSNFSNQGMECIKNFIDGFLMKSFDIENSFLLERLLFRNISNVDYTNYINFILCLKNYDIDLNRIFNKKLSENNYIKYFEEQVLKEINEHINLLNHFKNILARKDLINFRNTDESNQKPHCENCNAYETSVIHNKKYQLELIEEMNKLTFDLEMIHSHMRDLNLNNRKKTLNVSTSPTRNLAENKKIEKLYKNLSYDSVKLEKLIKDIDEVFKRTQTNISSIKSFCNDCKK